MTIAAYGRGMVARLFWLALSSFAVTACGSAAADGRVQRTRHGDTTIVHSVAPAFDTARLRQVALFGETEGAAEQMFAAVWGFVPYGDHLIVADYREGIREYDANGRFVRQVGRVGEGPAEVLGVRSMAVSPTGDLAVADIVNRKVVLYKQRGTIKTWPLPLGRPRYHEDAVFFDVKGALWVGFHPDPGRISGDRQPAYVKLDASGPGDTIWIPLEPFGSCTTPTDRLHAAGFWYDSRKPWLPKLEWTVAAGGELAVGCPAEYSFTVRGRDGTSPG